MIAIIGKIKNIFIINVFLCGLLYAGDISLRITTMDNQPLQEAGVGQPFLVHVVIQNSSNTAQRPTIKEHDHIMMRAAGFRMNMVNNTTSITYHYETRIDTAGSYTIGPASIIENGTLVESKPLIINVTAQQKLQPTSQTTNIKPQTILRLACDKEKVVVGQKVHCTLTFYTTDSRITLHDIKKPEAMGYTIKSSNISTQGRETINNTEYAYIRWEWDIIPTKTGTCTIPAYAADFSIPTSHNFFSMLMLSGDTKRIYSNTVQCTVQPLPAGNIQPLFIGSISSIQAKIESYSAKVGQGLVYSISFVGDGDFDTITEFPLKNIPDGLKWYESAQSCTPASHDPSQSHYTREYIIQALQPGTYHIPEQTLPYFDTQTQIYKTIKTMPLDITIHPDTTAKKNSPNNPIQVTEVDEIRPLHTDGPWYTPTLTYIPWPLFWMTIALLWLFILIIALFKSNLTIFSWFATRLAHKALYTQTKASLKQAHRQKRHEEIYTIFMNFLSKYANISPQSLNVETIDHLLSTQCSAQTMQEWQLFFSQLAELKFYAKKTDNQKITEQALYWVDLFATLKQEKK